MKTPKLLRLHGIIERLASAYKGSLPHELANGEFVSSNHALSSGTRTRLAMIEDCIKVADEITAAPKLKVQKAQFCFVYFSSDAYDPLNGEIQVRDDETMVISIIKGGAKPYQIIGRKNEAGGYEGEDLDSKVKASWSETIPGQYHGLWNKNNERFLFQIETSD